MKKVVYIFACLALLSVAVAGCGSGASEDKPIAEVKEEAKGLDVAQLQAMVAKYEKVIASKKAEIEKLTAKLKEIPIAQMMGKEAGKLKADIQNIASSVKALNERLAVYVRELRAKT